MALVHIQQVAPMPPTPRVALYAAPWWLGARAVAVWWIIAGAALLVGLGAPPVQRTQEARVLETAREMLGSGWRGWMIPSLDGHVRVRKPPLAYWMAAAAYKAGGVSEGVGRVPTALLGWLTLAVTFACAQWLFGRRAALFAAACLLCSHLFFRYARLAETDAPAMFFVTLGIYSFWRAVEEDAKEDAGTRGRGDMGNESVSASPRLRVSASSSPASSSPASSSPASPRLRVSASSSVASSAWFHLGAAATALAILSKGPPGAFPPLFLLGIVLLRRQWRALSAFVGSGAPLTLIVLALPWFVYVFHTVGLQQWKLESDELLGGEDHAGAFYQYFVELFKATAPWCLLMIGALIAALIAAWRFRSRDARVGGVLLWLALVFIPLCALPNKQFHYLMPLMPPMMILIGWWLDQALFPAGVPSTRRVPLVDATMLLTILAIPAIPLAAKLINGRVTPLEWTLAAEVAAGLLAVAIAFRWRGRTAALLVYTAAVLMVLVPAVALLAPRFEDVDSRSVARQIHEHFGDGPYCFYGKNLSVPLCFNWRRQVPQELRPGDLRRLADEQPGVVVIAQTKPAHAPPELPPGFVEQWRLPLPKQTIVFYRQSIGARAARVPD